MIKLAVPNNYIYDEILINCESMIRKGEISIFRLNENDCASHLLKNRVDAALLTPMGYAKGLFDADYRIIPGPALLSQAYTKAGTIIFGREVKSVKSFASDSPNDFMVTIGKLLLGERYNIFPSIDVQYKDIDNMLKNCDVVITWNGESEDRITLDISDEWYDMNEFALPLAFWVCRAEEVPENILNILNSLSSDSVENEIVEELPEGKDFVARQGKFFYRWNDDFERALEFTLHFLYYHQLITEIPAVKLLGRD
ncbi:MAG: hypothetical protein A2X61_09590 [Ignavibacteria bacterium GWB2_35_12]|nr:MAG: hypothetical protein A2X61_09590 [Ignavibacteria bacterium GWB2_35_12]OGU93638.1 MAG: hypothetical protein A2220_05610 [Ignavibacteria bacterium RIFOXYA2_FULL_35_10]OGV23576.1 MAG: hypothetical protein A2475_05375 [Ignavibacteria bacterium RIFOXYC2_FULL_35_21]